MNEKKTTRKVSILRDQDTNYIEHDVAFVGANIEAKKAVQEAMAQSLAYQIGFAERESDALKIRRFVKYADRQTQLILHPFDGDGCTGPHWVFVVVMKVTVSEKPRKQPVFTQGLQDYNIEEAFAQGDFVTAGG